MGSIQNPNDPQYFRSWVQASFLGWLIGFAVVVGLAVSIETVGLLNTNLMIGIGMGAGVGFMQGRIVKKWFSATNNWMWSSIIGMTIPFLATEFVDLGFNPLTLNVTLGGLLVGFLQLRILKPYSDKSIWWVPTCAIGWTLAAAGASNLLDAIPGMVVVSMVFGGAILGAITGKVLVWMIPPAASPSDNE